MTPIMTTQGIKAYAALDVQSKSADIAAGASVALTARVWLFSVSAEIGADADFECLEWDASTWSQVQTAEGTAYNPSNNVTRLIQPFGLHSSHSRVRNTNVGAQWIKVLYFQLIEA